MVERMKHQHILTLWRVFQAILKCSLLGWRWNGIGVDGHSKASIFNNFIKKVHQREADNKYTG